MVKLEPLPPQQHANVSGTPDRSEGCGIWRTLQRPVTSVTSSQNRYHYPMQAYGVQELIRAPMTWPWLFWASAAGEKKASKCKATQRILMWLELNPRFCTSFPHTDRTQNPPVASASDRANIYINRTIIIAASSTEYIIYLLSTHGPVLAGLGDILTVQFVLTTPAEGPIPARSQNEIPRWLLYPISTRHCRKGGNLLFLDYGQGYRHPLNTRCRPGSCLVTAQTAPGIQLLGFISAAVDCCPTVKSQALCSRTVADRGPWSLV